MSFMILALFIPACFALNMVPGPNNLLCMSNAQRYGFTHAIGAGAGRIMAFVIMIVLAATGLAALLYASKTLFLVVKIIGALYLFWIAYQLYNAKVEQSVASKEGKKSLYQLARQEFLLAAGNPKAILIFTAFLPQFIDASQAVNYQFFILGAVFLCLECLAVAIYAGFGVYLRHWFSQPAMRSLFNRGCAVVIGAMGVGLLVDRKS
ncbi:MAG: LysE family translocator [Oceanospirillaceae bacterium]|nr:LysE family translocator [Oceanospirillaceae bacterium]